MLPCQKCGYDNELGRIFCHQCGSKLDLDAIKPVSRGGKSLKSKKGDVLKWIRRVIVLSILGVVGYALFAMLQVVAEPDKPADPDIRAADKKWMAVERMVARKQAGSVEVSPVEAKAFLAAIRTEKKDVNWGFVLERVGIEFAPDSIELGIWGTLRLGGALEKKLWLTYSGAPTVQGGKITFETKGGAVGRLKWPAAVVNALGLHRYIFLDALGRLKMQTEILSQLSQIEVHADRVVLHYQPR
jgi:hypothetical protein